MPGEGRRVDLFADVFIVKGMSDRDAFSVIEYVAAR